MGHAKRWAKLIQATQTFVDIANAHDDLAAVDALRRHVYASKKAGIFSDLVDIARYLNSAEVDEALGNTEAVLALEAAGLDMTCFDGARLHAKRFLSETTSHLRASSSPHTNGFSTLGDLC